MSSPRAVLRSRRSRARRGQRRYPPAGRRRRRWPMYTPCDVGSADANTRSRPSSPASGASARSRWPTTTTRSGRRSAARRSRPARSRSGATPTSCRRPQPGGRSRRRVHAAGAGRPPRGRARPRRGVDQERHREPDQLVQGPGDLGRAVEGARVRLQGRGVRVHRQPRQLGGRARGARRAAQLRVHPRQPRAGQDRHHRGLRRQRRRHRRQLRRRQPAVRGARRAPTRGRSST